MKFSAKILSLFLLILLVMSFLPGCDVENDRNKRRSKKDKDETVSETLEDIETETEPDTNKGGSYETETEISSNKPNDDVTETETSNGDEFTTESNRDEETNEENSSSCSTHADIDDNGKCDICNISVIVFIDFYTINDLHGKFKDTDSNIGVDELTTYLKNTSKTDDYTVFLSSGDMWQGSSESNLTKGFIITEWLNELDFVSLTLGNHEYDWGEEYIELNEDFAEFPFLAINIYDRSTGQRVDYCQPSVVIERNGIQIGIIGAMGDCYSSISSDKTEDIYFKVGSELTALVKAESQRLRSLGVDFIVYSLHDGYGQNKSSVTHVTKSQISSYYDTELSNGYVDLVFEGHTHQSYVLIDEYGVYHLQGGGDNKGITHVEIAINSVTYTTIVTDAAYVKTNSYSYLQGDSLVDELLEKYKDEIAKGDEVLGNISQNKYSSTITKKVAELYYQKGLELWGDQYSIVLGGGYLKTRSPYELTSGTVKYSDLQTILPFDNQIVLCAIKGSDLLSKFFETSNSNYQIYYGSYGESVKNNIVPDSTYYIITDTYTSSYSYNNLTEIARLDEDIYARDLLAEYIKNGGWK